VALAADARLRIIPQIPGTLAWSVTQVVVDAAAFRCDWFY
jgi:hypothetical protein